MKIRSTTSSSSFTKKASLVAVSVMVASTGLLGAASQVLARDYDAEIKAKEQEANKYSNESSRLGQMADSLQVELNKINEQIAAIQDQITLSQRKIDNLTKQIVRTQEQIKQNRKALGQILADIHIDDQITPLEMLASSNSIGDYIDKQEQRSSLRSSLNTKIKEIKELQRRLEQDKKAVEQTLKDQKAQNAVMSAKKAEKDKLMADTKNDQNAYADLAKKRNSEVASLRAQQAAENARAFRSSGNGAIPPPSGGNGGYPAVWANAPIDSIVDSWGMYNRECVSYVAYRIASSGRNMPYWGGRGHAYQWPGNAASAGIPTGSTPRAGAAAVSYGGPYGHIMYVESVNGDGTITVSDYNFAMDGLYRNYSRSASGLTYIYF